MTITDGQRDRYRDNSFRTLLAISERLLGPDHPTFATLMRGLAPFTCRTESTPKAMRCSGAASPSTKRRWARSPQSDPLLDILAARSFIQGRYVESGELAKRLLESSERGLGPDHPEVGDAGDGR